jgi:hypothetical protein
MIIERAILRINPDAKISIINDDIDRITWLDGTTPISKTDIEAELSAAELDIALDNLRQKRNALLLETDYLGLSDQSMSDDIKTYRQELRDLTNGLTTVEQVEAVTWPTKPGA